MFVRHLLDYNILFKEKERLNPLSTPIAKENRHSVGSMCSKCQNNCPKHNLKIEATDIWSSHWYFKAHFFLNALTTLHSIIFNICFLTFTSSYSVFNSFYSPRIIEIISPFLFAIEIIVFILPELVQVRRITRAWRRINISWEVSLDWLNYWSSLHFIRQERHEEN